MQSGAKLSVAAYARRYGTDRYTAYDELTALGCELPKSDRRYATRPPPAKRPPKPVAPEPCGLPDGWIEFCGHVLMPVGWTSGGFPYGPSWDDVFGEGSDRLPEETVYAGPDYGDPDYGEFESQEFEPLNFEQLNFESLEFESRSSRS